ncbi:MAG: hypothetical protein KAT46_02375 [Deltaproteobacteria bacterium]|nr:hypothetical protein [Deltaproteobacteria bacterium]
MRLLVALIFFFTFFTLTPQIALGQDDDEYSFDISEIEKKPYSIGGYGEVRAVLFGLDKDASLYKLRFYNHHERDVLDEYNFTLQLDGSYERGITSLYLKSNTDIRRSYLGWSEKTTLFEGYISLKPSSSITFDIGKKTLKWGKGYAWNPAAFIDRPKNPDDTTLALEGFIVASIDYIKSFKGPLKTISFTPVLIPVYEDVNEEFGEIDELNFAGKLYLLYYDTDIDLTFLTGGSKTTRYGFDFSKNISSSFEMHGEAVFINNFNKKLIDSTGQISERKNDITSYLLGIRYLTRSDTTYIFEYYHNGTGFRDYEMRDYFSFIDSAYDTFITLSDDSLLQKASNVTEGIYGRTSPMRDYLYLRISHKEPFDILYFTPALTSVFNINDNSFTLSPELLYNAITNLELRFRSTFTSGESGSEFGEKQNKYRMELRARYYF